MHSTGTVVLSYNGVCDLSDDRVHHLHKTQRSGMKSFPKLEQSYCLAVKQTQHLELVSSRRLDVTPCHHCSRAASRLRLT